uniref:Xylulose kinase-1 n=1 Tax=Tanacetum cinerariifolium TaxID=118510 RepID=A0A6L2KVR1_TANCI|nr:xylulose kinase-1 [Tanacetum cinerariifolium]
MANLEFVDQYNMVACLERTDGNAEFHQIVDFLTTSLIHYALTVSPTIYASYIEKFWATIKSKTVNDVKQIHATIDAKTVVISESSVRSDLHFNDEDGITCLSNDGTGSGSRPRCQDTTLRDAFAQTRFETASKESHNPHLLEVNTSGSGEDSIEHQDDLTDCVPPTPHDLPLSGGYTPGSDIDDDYDYINDMVDEAMENVEGDTVNAGGVVNATTTGVSATISYYCWLRKKGVAFKDVEESIRPTTILLTIDPKDKGKGIIQEPKKRLKNQRKAQIQLDEELAKRMMKKKWQN